MNKSLLASNLTLLFIGLVVGVFIGLALFESQVVKTYEDGSFIGCYKGAQCND